jgi:formyl-CoA transferase
MASAVESDALGSIELVSQAIKMSRTPSSLAVAPPERSEHTDEILRDLDFDDAAIADLRHRNVI